MPEHLPHDQWMLHRWDLIECPLLAIPHGWNKFDEPFYKDEDTFENGKNMIGKNYLMNFKIYFLCNKTHKSYIHHSFWRPSLSCIYVTTTWMLVTALNISIKKLIIMRSMYLGLSLKYKTILNLLTTEKAA